MGEEEVKAAEEKPEDAENAETAEKTPESGGEENGKALGQPVTFAPLQEDEGKISGVENLDLILDVSTKITVELGRTEMLIKDVLNLNIGSVVEISKLAGEPVDILVNNKQVAKGEVVVINENFGVRISEILGAEQRIRKLGSEEPK